MHYELNEMEASIIEAYRIANEDVKCLFDACTATAHKTQEVGQEAISLKDLKAANVEQFTEGDRLAAEAIQHLQNVRMQILSTANPIHEKTIKECDSVLTETEKWERLTNPHSLKDWQLSVNLNKLAEENPELFAQEVCQSLPKSFNPNILESIPQEIMEAERKLSTWFAQNNIQTWGLGRTKSRF